MCRQTEKIGPTLGLPRHIHFVVFFNVPIEALTLGQPFYGYPEKLFHFRRLLRRSWGYGGPILVLNPWILSGIYLWYCL